MCSQSTILIGGGTGFIGSNLGRALTQLGYNVTTVSRLPGLNHISWTDLQERGIPQNTTAIINTCGQNVFDIRRRWTEGFKQNVWASRVNTTKNLARAIDNSKSKPSVFITMSGVGYYQPSDVNEYTEDSPGGNFDFLSQLVKDWENASILSNSPSVRNVILRSGVVLGRGGGVISQMYWPFWFGFGGTIGDGSQYFPWIHLHDLIAFIIYAIEEKKDVNGVFNAVSPQIITNRDFVKALGRAMWRPTLFPVPKQILNIAFNEERAKIMTEGQKVIPKRITEQTSFTYTYPNIDDACKQCAKMIYTDEVVQ